jgi:hypothetical protein
MGWNSATHHHTGPSMNCRRDSKTGFSYSPSPQGLLDRGACGYTNIDHKVLFSKGYDHSKTRDDV